MLQQMGEGERLELEDTSRLPSVEEAHEVESKIALQPEDVRISAMHQFGHARVRKALVQNVQRASQFKSVDEEIFVARRDLHQAAEAAIRAIRVVFEVDRKLGHRSELGAHLL